MTGRIVLLPVALLVFFPVGCADETTVPDAQAGVTVEGLPGFLFSAPALDEDGTTRIQLVYDMEGLSGQDDWRTTMAWHPEQYEKGREYLTADVNAVIAGLFDGGADEVVVVGGHASGSPEPDILLEQMDARAEFLDWTTMTSNIEIDAIAAVGMHSRTGGGGFMAHTNQLGMDYIVNGRHMNETEQMMYRSGEAGTPVVFVAGDDKLREQLLPYPWIEYVITKFATSASTAELRPVEAVHEEMRAAAARAVETIPAARAVVPKTPITAGLRASPPADLSFLEGVPGITSYQDQTVTFEAESFLEARRGMSALMRAARSGYRAVMMQTLARLDPRLDPARLDPSCEIELEPRDIPFQLWLDYESGRWAPPDEWMPPKR
jgi:D-amino peptidase